MNTLPNHGYLMTDRNGNVVAWFADFLQATDFGTAHGARLGLNQRYLGEGDASGALLVHLEGRTMPEQFEGLVSLVCMASRAKEDSDTKEWPSLVSESGSGQIRFVPNVAVSHAPETSRKPQP